MKKIYIDELSKLKQKSFVDQKIYNQFWRWINTETKILKADGTQHHVCVMFAPFDRQTKQIFLIHHRKADLWMIPGGHVEPNEKPVDCVIREFAEELGKKMLPQQIELFNLAITSIENPRQTCKTHYDLWYIVNTPVETYTLEPGAFYSASWYSLDVAVKKVIVPGFQTLLRKLADYTL